MTRGFPRTDESPQHIDAPEVAQKHTKKNPSTPPNKAPESILKNIGPGIAKV